MSMETSRSSPVPTNPPIGTYVQAREPIGTLQLVEVLGHGGYGVVYRAVCVGDSARLRGERSYAVKCLNHFTSKRAGSRKEHHQRERCLHQLVSEHEHIVTLYDVLEETDRTFMIMDYAPDHDLFTQILHNRRYLGNSQLIKDIFLQVLDAVEHCHRQGIYHRDLKPENILCFDNGCRIALTDFGLATRDEWSREFRTGSLYHMSPECQQDDPEANAYSPRRNDVWSLGIVLLNLATGRNPWKSATLDDPTYLAYLRDPIQFLPSVLPISDELNNVLVRTLEVQCDRRSEVANLRRDVLNLGSFYSKSVVFKGSLACCHWENEQELGIKSTDVMDDAKVNCELSEPRWRSDMYSVVKISEGHQGGCASNCATLRGLSNSDLLARSADSGQRGISEVTMDSFGNRDMDWLFDDSNSTRSKGDPARTVVSSPTPLLEPATLDDPWRTDDDNLSWNPISPLFESIFDNLPIPETFMGLFGGCRRFQSRPSSPVPSTTATDPLSYNIPTSRRNLGQLRLRKSRRLGKPLAGKISSKEISLDFNRAVGTPSSRN